MYLKHECKKSERETRVERGDKCIKKDKHGGYLHLPAKWLGGRNPLGWEGGPYGDGGGCPEPIGTERMK